MPTGVYKLFINGIKDTIQSQLKVICSRSNRAAFFAQKVWPAQSTEISFPVDSTLSSTKSKYKPDASFWHNDAQYLEIIIEVAYLQKRKRLGWLADDYLLDSNANIWVIVGLDIKYSKKGLCKATLLV